MLARRGWSRSEAGVVSAAEDAEAETDADTEGEAAAEADTPNEECAPTASLPLPPLTKTPAKTRARIMRFRSN